MVGAVGSCQSCPNNPIGSANGPRNGTGPQALKMQQDVEQQVQQQQQQQIREQQRVQQQQIAAMTGLGMQLDIQG
jgi:hypothetical protein